MAAVSSLGLFGLPFRARTFAAKPLSTLVRFRKTLSGIGTRTGSRQVQT